MITQIQRLSIKSLKLLLALVWRKNKPSLAQAAWRVLRTQGILGLQRSVTLFLDANVAYGRWIRLHDTLGDRELEEIRRRIAALSSPPLLSVLMPTYNTPATWLRRSIESVRTQLYPHWELCIADDASSMPHVRAMLSEYQNLDKRIKVVFREHNGHISAASNSALALASGQFVALLDHDDEIPPHALYMVANAVHDAPHLDLLYSDEDKIDAANVRHSPCFKPDWNPDLMTSQNMVSHLGVYRTDVVRKVGGFREGYEGAQDWDLALRVTELVPASHIKHLPYILYHWRAIPGSTAAGHNEKDYAVRAGEKALNDHFARLKQSAEVIPAVGGYFHVRYAIPSPAPLVSIIIPTRNGTELLKKCIGSILEKTRYPAFEIMVIDNQSDDAEALSYLSLLEQKKQAKVVRYDAPFNYSAINNFAADRSAGTLLCLMNNDVEVISDDWLDEMVAQASRPEIGAVGAMLYYPDDTIQHAGVVLGMGGVAGHAYARQARGTCGYMNRACLTQNLSAITAACLVVRKNVFQEVNGLDETNLTVAFNDIDFCLRLLGKGYRNLWTPRAELYHHESASRGYEDTPEKLRRFRQECAYMQTRWGTLLQHDPAYNPNLTLDDAWPYLAREPRIIPPWKRR